MDEQEPENIDEYFSSAGEEEYDDSDTDSEVETEIKKKEPIKIGGAFSDEESEGEGEDEDADENVDADADDDGEVESEEEEVEPETKGQKPLKQMLQIVNSDDENENDEEDTDSDDEGYLQKFDKEINNNYILNMHPECKTHNYDEIEALSKVVYNSDGIISDPLHRTIPVLTKYERARVLGQRAKQINSGSKPFVKVPENIIDGYLIAEIELAQKRIPFIIRRPFPGGGSEYWNLKDLELINY
jgi:DNA-directed RNA polymerase I, II, and III subunit RPABC2